MAPGKVYPSRLATFLKMITFSGAYDCKMDPKGRIVLPSRLKARLPETGSNRIFILRGFKKCLMVYTQNHWEEKLESFAKVSEFEDEGYDIIRSLTFGMADEELDGQGRFSLNKKLIQYAGLSSDVLVVGVGKLIEIWNPEEYDKELIQDRQKLRVMARNLLDAQPTTTGSSQ